MVFSGLYFPLFSSQKVKVKKNLEGKSFGNRLKKSCETRIKSLILFGRKKKTERFSSIFPIRIHENFKLGKKKKKKRDLISLIIAIKSPF